MKPRCVRKIQRRPFSVSSYCPARRNPRKLKIPAFSNVLKRLRKVKGRIRDGRAIRPVGTRRRTRLHLQKLHQRDCGIICFRVSMRPARRPFSLHVLSATPLFPLSFSTAENKAAMNAFFLSLSFPFSFSLSFSLSFSFDFAAAPRNAADARRVSAVNEYLPL